MSGICVFGLGLMGSSLARALMRSGHQVTVWNRSPVKAQPLVAWGATHAANVAAAVEACPVLLICIDSYRTTHALFSTHDVKSLLAGRTVVQLTTGTPREAREAAQWFASLGADYLDGGILGGPAAIGTPRVILLYSGSNDAYARCLPMLKSLGENSRFAGADPGAAAALDIAWLSNRFGTYVSAAHGAMLCEAEGVDLDLYANVFAANDPARWVIDTIRTQSYENPAAALKVWNAALRIIQEQARDCGIGSEFPDFVAGILDRAETAGYGEEDIAAMIKILRGGKVS